MYRVEIEAIIIILQFTHKRNNLNMLWNTLKIEQLVV